jgi:hypothetical protein
MSSRQRPSQRRAKPARGRTISFHQAGVFVALALLLAGIGVGGCASPGDPTARQRSVVPQAVKDLSAWQQGDEFVLSFTLPGQSVRNEPLAAPPGVEIYRGAAEPGGGVKPPEKVSTRLIYTIPSEVVNSYVEEGKIVFRDRIEPGQLTHTPGTAAEYIYAVRTRAERNRSSAESNRVMLHIEPPPEPVAEVRARLTQTTAETPSMTVTLEWPRDANTVYYVYRAEITPESASAAVTDASKAVLQKPLAKVTEERTSENAGDSLLQYRDTKIEPGHTYMYIVRRATEFIGPYTVVSADSKPVLITVSEKTPPAAPQGVEAVVVPAAQQAGAYMSLSWAISPEADVAGYAVYRSEQADARGTRLNESLLGSPTYRDLSAAPGRRYFYSVTAVDGAGQESAPSATVEAQIPQ